MYWTHKYWTNMYQLLSIELSTFSYYCPHFINLSMQLIARPMHVELPWWRAALVVLGRYYKMNVLTCICNNYDSHPFYPFSHLRFLGECW